MSAGSDGSGADPSLSTAVYESTDDVLDVLRPVMHAIATAGGPRCEVVLHDLSAADLDLGHTIVAIENGYVTGRQVGGPSTNLGLGVVHNQAADHNAFGYRGFTPDGREFRSSSLYFRNSAGEVIAALCINFDISMVRQVQGILDGLVPGHQEDRDGQTDEVIGRDLVAVMDGMIDEAIRSVGKPVNQLDRAERIAVLTRLERQGALHMKKSVERIASRLRISRVTAYSYLDQMRVRDQKGPEHAQQR